ncbi:MAG TPA: hypothetical protein PK033_03785 [Acetivibrio sp.]|nr:hypothetical protein [Acetivibrio sp.]
MMDTRYIVFRCYSREAIYTFSKSIINMINLLASINNEGEYYLRHNLSQDSSQKNISLRSLKTFLGKIKNKKVKDFEFICRLKDVDSNKVFPFRFQITYDNHRYYMSQAYGSGKINRDVLISTGPFRIEVCIQSHLIPEDLFSKFETAFKDLYMSSKSSYGYWDIMDMRDALFSKRSTYEKKLIMDRAVAEQYNQRVAGVFTGNFLNPSHMEMFKEYFSGIMEDCKYEELANGTFYLKLSKEQEESIKNNSMFSHILPVEADYQPEKIKPAFILKESHVERLGGIDVIKKCLPDKASLVEYNGGIIIIYRNEYVNDINELLAFLQHLYPFRTNGSPSASKEFADYLSFILTDEDEYNLLLCIGIDESLSSIHFGLFNADRNPEFYNLKNIISDWLASCEEESKVSSNEKTSYIQWEMNSSSVNDVRIIELHNLLNKYAVEKSIYAFFRIGDLKKEGFFIMRKMQQDGLLVTL